VILKLENVQKKLDGQVILPDISLEINESRIIGLLGPNGSGKTTLLKLIAGLSRPTFGKLYFEGIPYKYPQVSWFINYLPDQNIFPTSYTVKQAIEFYKYNFNDFDIDKMLQILTDLQIPTHTSIRNMSKGQQERLLLGLVLSRNSRLLILDEPLAAIDVVTRDEILFLLKKYLQRNVTIIISTHLIFDMQDLFDEAIFINNGAITMYETVANIQQKYNMDLLTFYRNYYRLSNNIHQQEIPQPVYDGGGNNV